MFEQWRPVEPHAIRTVSVVGDLRHPAHLIQPGAGISVVRDLFHVRGLNGQRLKRRFGLHVRVADMQGVLFDAATDDNLRLTGARLLTTITL